tara:strand:+ start:2656 stop:4263 length:1608 start_codon:yes stop_codon:yes gene_type:complete
VLLTHPLLKLRKLKKKFKIIYLLYFLTNRRKIIESYKGYRKLKVKEKLDTLHKIKSEIMDISLKYDDGFLNKILKKNYSEDIFKQFLSNYFLSLGSNFSFQFYYCISTKKKFIYPLPREILVFIDNNYIKVNFFLSNIIWNTYLILFFVKNFFKSFFIYFESIFHYVKGKNIDSETNIFLGNNYFIDQKFVEENFFFEQLLNAKELRKKNIIFENKTKIHSKKVINIEKFSFGPKTFIQFIIFSKNFFKVLFVTFFKILKFDLYSMIYFDEIIKLFKFESAHISNTNFIFSDNWTYRPIWSYFSDESQNKAIYYFYSSNIEGFKLKNKSNIPFFMLKNLTWENYVVFDEFQKNFIVKLGKREINFYYSLKFLNTNPVIKKNRKIAVFDVMPYKKFETYLEDVRYESLSFNFRKKFISDIVSFKKKFNLEILIKPKRSFSLAHHKGYEFYLNKLKNDKVIEILEPQYDINKIIQSSDFSISCPFTSTALIAKSLNRPCIYYDTTGLVDTDDPAAHNVEVINSFEKLDDFFSFFYRS